MIGGSPFTLTAMRPFVTVLKKIDKLAVSLIISMSFYKITKTKVTEKKKFNLSKNENVHILSTNLIAINKKQGLSAKL